MNIKHILFDFDGTLADTMPIFVDIYKELSVTQGFKPLTAGDLPELRRMSIPEKCAKMGVPLTKLVTLRPRFMKLFRERLPNIRIFDGIPELLHELRARSIPVSILSSNDSDIIKEVLRRHQLETAFTSIAPSSSLFGKHKSIKKFLSSQGYRNGELLYVGDEQRDIEACKKVYVPVAAVSWGFDHEETLRSHKPDLFAWQPADIAAYVRKTLEGGSGA